MDFLLDSNVLLAAVLRSHPHHALSKKWFESDFPGKQLKICRSVQISFLRLLTSKSWLKEDAKSNLEAMVILDKILMNPAINLILDEPPGVGALWYELSKSKLSEPKVWMDAYLTAFAISCGSIFVTFDKGFTRYKQMGLKLELLQG